jgi:uncharacterized protein YecE (DUF72 family)
MIRVGCSGFPAKREDYFGKFDIVELDSTLYNLPTPSTAIRWQDEAPEGFEFIVKVWQPVTHPADSPTYRRTELKISEARKHRYGGFRMTREVMDAWEMTREVGRILHSRLFLFQSPPDFNESTESVLNLRVFFEKIERGKSKMVWEPRGEWSEETLLSLCRDLNLVRCIDPFSTPPLDGDIAYYRLHGRGGYGYKHSEKDLDELLNLCPEAKDSYVMFSNISMLEDALRFKFMARSRKHPA